MAEHAAATTWQDRVAPWQEPEITAHEVQAGAEGVEVQGFDTVEFYGMKFRLAEGVSMMPLLAFGNAAKQGLDSDDFEGMAAMYRMIRSVIHRPPVLDDDGREQVNDDTGMIVRDETEWERFQAVADDRCAQGEDIMGFVNQAMAVMSARPTKRPGISSDSRPPTSENSRAVSSSQDTARRLGLVSVADL